MIPYFKLTVLPLGPLEIKVWGLMVASGILVALLLAQHLAKQRKLNPEILLDLAVWALIPALIFGRLGYVLFYDWPTFSGNPWFVFRVWEAGLSSFGGYFGAALGIWLFVRRQKISLQPYAEIAAYALPLGYGLGRLGCFFIHDHPGVRSSIFFAVAFPDGSRLDHGLLLALFGFLMFAVFAVLKWRGWQPGETKWRYLPLLLVVYGLTRFVLGFFRAWDLILSDVRFYYLTPAQYGAVILIVLGIYLWRINRSD
ncbi:prolipoprotein diacylglyceryl transferase [Patescibacteria group bacterium]|nr:prolipoprotein diacylglyceryl transferase [Patescibacteria group bacterium]MBU1028829.1 prolipoprotein diacylglyceryl transferase [Patescibacteria group bacterium]MBU1916042.1 prolipoprotein diacylglyceryl transferase [Patescibacteria group bacterium]